MYTLNNVCEIHPGKNLMLFHPNELYQFMDEKENLSNFMSSVFADFEEFQR